MNQQFMSGDMIRVDRIAYQHVGIYVGRQKVVHNDKFGGVVLSTLTEFAAGDRVVLDKRGPAGYLQSQAVVKRAFSLIGKKFNLLFFNCEHAANWAQTGKVESPQLQGWVILLGLVGVLFAGRRG